MVGLKSRVLQNAWLTTLQFTILSSYFGIVICFYAVGRNKKLRSDLCHKDQRTDWRYFEIIVSVVGPCVFVVRVTNAPFNAILFFCRRPANKTLQVKAPETDRSCAQSKSAASDVQTMRCVYDEWHNVSESAAYCVCESQRVWCVLVETLQKRLNRSRCPLAGRQNCVDPWEPCIKQNGTTWHHLANTTDWSMRRRRCGLSLPLM